jgi:hypothetical protein
MGIHGIVPEKHFGIYPVDKAGGGDEPEGERESVVYWYSI